MRSYAYGCSSLIELVLPAVGWFKDNNVNWNVPSGRLGVLKGRVLHSDDLNSWKALTAEGKTLYTNYIRDPDLVYWRKIAKVEAPVTAIAAITAQGKKIAKAQVHIIATTVLSVSGAGEEIQVEQGQAHVKTLSSFDVAGEKRARSPPAVLTGEAEVAAEGKKVAKGQVTLTATSEIKVTGRKIITGKADIKADSEINVQAKTRRQGQAVIPAISEIAVKGKYEPPYKQLIIGLSVQERQISLSVQERQIGLSVQEYKVKLEVEGMPLIGDTIRLKGEFKDLDGNLTDIEEPKVVIYDNRRNVIKEATPTKTGTGIYYYDLVVPDYPEAGKRNEPLVFEFSGQLGGQPVVGRSSFERMWSE